MNEIYKEAGLKLDEIALELKKDSFLSCEDIGLLTGIAGNALFLFNYYQYTGKEDYAELGRGYILEIIDRLNSGYSFPTYSSGIAGAVWAIEHLNEHQFIKFNSDKNFKAIDDYLWETMMSGLEAEEFDFLHSSIGYGYYFLKRYQLTKSAAQRKKVPALSAGPG